jgi:Flp pilus assembly protein TadB
VKILNLMLGKYFWRLYLVLVTLLGTVVVVYAATGANPLAMLGAGALAGGTGVPAARRRSRRRRAARRSLTK